MKATKMEKILLTKNEDLAKQHIEDLKRQAVEATKAIREYNNIGLLSPIKTSEQVIEFLEDPVAYLDNAIISDISFSSKVQPPPQGIAKLYEIDYDGITQKLSVVKLRSMENYTFNEKSLSIEFNPKCEKKVMRSFYDYATAEEAAHVAKIRELCKLLNEYCERWDIDTSSMSVVAENLGLKCSYLAGAKRGDERNSEFTEHIQTLRSKIEYERTWG